MKYSKSMPLLTSSAESRPLCPMHRGSLEPPSNSVECLSPPCIRMDFKSNKRTRVVYLAMVEAGSDIALVNGERYTSNLHPQSHANRGKI
jgi:hypothetical protein